MTKATLHNIFRDAVSPPRRDPLLALLADIDRRIKIVAGADAPLLEGVRGAILDALHDLRDSVLKLAGAHERREKELSLDLDAQVKQNDALAEMCGKLLTLHVAHHNQPLHAHARDLLRRVARCRGPEGRAEAAPTAGRNGDHNPTPDASTVAGNNLERP